MAFVDVIDCTKTYTMGESLIMANDKVSFEVEQGEFAIIVGPSGAGKSTTLNILGGMDTADSGEIWVDGINLAALDAHGLTQYRRETIGFVFQFYNLIPNLTALENVEISAQISPKAKDSQEVLEQVGLGHRLYNFPSQLSGGEQQRVAIARSLAKNPKLLLADEPTGALDYRTGKEVLALLQDTCRTTGTTVIVITHNAAIAPIADRTIEIYDAKVRSVTLNPHPADIADIEW